eukprot:CAMPEP_0202950150 /NCGR_PEP_ID=MMETSP1395-20130829/19612_1 /ASSEMBLY_ACC=CAM_ASM_000871 /TAXON_ID=5961 /ORGANISM="Blepharisma japonicum, Strain Stock R1072" /LENGTH=66 /DNA_ID=CAMNT_0049654033 /DNA_START=877 /DNA_END=1077 /DNA_ORIENTATION=+
MSGKTEKKPATKGKLNKKAGLKALGYAKNAISTKTYHFSIIEIPANICAKNVSLSQFQKEKQGVLV